MIRALECNITYLVCLEYRDICHRLGLFSPQIESPGSSLLLTRTGANIATFRDSLRTARRRVARFTDRTNARRRIDSLRRGGLAVQVAPGLPWSSLSHGGSYGDTENRQRHRGPGQEHPGRRNEARAFSRSGQLPDGRVLPVSEHPERTARATTRSSVSRYRRADRCSLGSGPEGRAIGSLAGGGPEWSPAPRLRNVCNQVNYRPRSIRMPGQCNACDRSCARTCAADRETLPC